MLTVQVRDSEGRVVQVPFDRPEVTIGRQDDCVVHLPERNVSRNHARLVQERDAVYLEPVAPRYGIALNGQRLAGRDRVRLQAQDEIRIGDYVLTVEGLRGPAPAPSTKAGGTAVVDIRQVQAAVGAEAATEVEPPHRMHLFVVSQNLAGKHFVLDRAPLVMGRTPDNDIVLKHPSISQHHARITFHNGAFSIVDLGSSNRVLVNGEPYAQIELRVGDLIELGHVKLRLVRPGESASIVQEPETSEEGPAETPRKKRTLLLLLLVLGLCGAVAVVFFLYFWPKDTIETGLPAHPDEVRAAAIDAGGPTAPAADVRPAAAADVAAAPAAPDVRRASDVQARAPEAAPAGEPPQLAEARELLKAEEWGKAAEQLRALATKRPDLAVVKELLATATKEESIGDSYSKIQKLAERKQFDQAFDAVRKQFDFLPSTSVYFERFQQLRDQIKASVVAEKAAFAKRQLDANKVPQAVAACKEALELEPDDRACKAIMAEARRRQGGGASEPQAAGTDLFSDPVLLLREAKQARRDGDCHRAIELLRYALKIRGSRDVWSEMAQCYDSLGQRTEAIAAYKRVMSMTKDEGQRERLIEQIRALGGTP